MKVEWLAGRVDSTVGCCTAVAAVVVAAALHCIAFSVFSLQKEFF